MTGEHPYKYETNGLISEEEAKTLSAEIAQAKFERSLKIFRILSQTATAVSSGAITADEGDYLARKRIQGLMVDGPELKFVSRAISLN